MEDPSDYFWTGAAYAAKQPRGNAHWNAIIDEMMHEIDLYLQFMALVKSI